MLRSMIIGLVIASLLQFGVRFFVPAGAISLASQRIDWMTMQADAVDRLICRGYTLLTR